MNFAVTDNDIKNHIEAAFNFSIEKLPLVGPENMRTPWYGLFRSDTMEVVGGGSKTKRYIPHQTEDIVALAKAAGESFGGGVNVSCHFRNGHHVIVEPTRHERLNVFGTGDNVWPRIIIDASYNGKAFSARLGYYRDLCHNLAELKTVTETSISIRHTRNLPSKMDELVATFGKLSNSWHKLKDVILKMEQTEVDWDVFMDRVFPEYLDLSDRQKRSRDKKLMEIKTRHNRERWANHRGTTPVTAWEAYNAVQGYTQHDKTVRKEFNNGMDRIIKAAHDGSVKRAEELAISLSA